MDEADEQKEKLESLEEELKELQEAFGELSEEDDIYFEERDRGNLIHWVTEPGTPWDGSESPGDIRNHIENWVKSRFTDKRVEPRHGDLLVLKYMGCLKMCFVSVPGYMEAAGANDCCTQEPPPGGFPHVRTFTVGDVAGSSGNGSIRVTLTFFDNCTEAGAQPDCDCESYPLASSSGASEGTCYSFEVLTDISTQSGDSGEAIKLVPKKRVVKIDKCGNVAGIEAVTEDTPIPIPCCDEEDPPEMTCQELKERASHTIGNWKVWWTANAGDPQWLHCSKNHGGTLYRMRAEQEGAADSLGKVGVGIFQKDPVTYLNYTNSCTPTTVTTNGPNSSFRLVWDSLNNTWTITFPGGSGAIALAGCENLLGTYELVAGAKLYEFTIS